MHTYSTRKEYARGSLFNDGVIGVSLGHSRGFFCMGNLRCIFWAVLALLGVSGKAADIDFSVPVTITGNASDILTLGTNLYAYAWNGTAGTVTNNGVSFKLTNQKNTNIDGNLSVTHGAYYGGNNEMSAASSLPADYKKLVGGIIYEYLKTSASVTLQRLTAGHQYAVQFWGSDSRPGQTGTTVSNMTGDAVAIDFNHSNSAGGVGQFVVGGFVASGTTEPLIFSGGQSYLNALQLRDVSGLGYWTGITGSTLDDSSASFSTTLFDTALTTGDLAAAEASGHGQVTFADTYFDSGTAIAVTQTNLTVASGGVSAQRVYFLNHVANYTLASADTNGIRGASTLVKSGTGQVTLVGTNSYTGATIINRGTFRIGDGGTAGSLNNASVITLGKSATLAFDRTDNYGGTVSNVITGSGALIVNGGTLALGGANIYTGPTTVNGGTLSIPISRASPDITTWGLLTINSNATFTSAATAPFGYPSANQESVEKLISFFVNGGTLSYLPTALTGIQFKNLRMSGGRVLLNAKLLVYGDISTDDGTLPVIEKGGPSPQLLLRKPATDTFFTVGSNATLTVGVPINADNSWITNATLGFAKKGEGTLLLTAMNIYSGATTIVSGNLQVGNGGTSGTLGLGTVTNNATLVFNRSDSYGGDFINAISGAGNLTLASGTLSLTGTNTYSGATVVSNGTLRLAHSQALAAGTDVSVFPGAKIELDFTEVCTVKSLAVNGVLLTRNKLYSKDNLPAALSGNGCLLTTVGPAPRGTLLRVY